jgi:hypothetical protein
VTDNLAVAPEDYDPFCITAPLDPRLPGGGGYQACGFFDVKPASFGLSENLVRSTSRFGTAKYVNDFVNVSFDARLSNGIRFGGGIDTGRSVQDTCFVVDTPQDLLYCREVTPFSGQTQLKLNGSLPLPGGVSFAGTYQNISGPTYNANYPATSEEIAPSLGRPLAGGVRTVTIPLVAPNTLYEGRTTRLDVRVSKTFRFDRVRLQVNLDSYNALNSDAIRTVNSTLNARWREPNSVIDPRHVQLGGQISF